MRLLGLAVVASLTLIACDEVRRVDPTPLCTPDSSTSCDARVLTTTSGPADALGISSPDAELDAGAAADAGDGDAE